MVGRTILGPGSLPLESFDRALTAKSQQSYNGGNKNLSQEDTVTQAMAGYHAAIMQDGVISGKYRRCSLSLMT